LRLETALIVLELAFLPPSSERRYSVVATAVETVENYLLALQMRMALMKLWVKALVLLWL
jgi:hypothetical protein